MSSASWPVTGMRVPPKVAQPSPSAVTSRDRKSTRLNSIHLVISYAVFCLKNKHPAVPPQQLAHPLCPRTDAHSDAHSSPSGHPPAHHQPHDASSLTSAPHLRPSSLRLSPS